MSEKSDKVNIIRKVLEREFFGSCNRKQTEELALAIVEELDKNEDVI